MDILDFLWRFLHSRRLTVALLSAVLLSLALGALLPQMPEGLPAGSPELAQWRADVRARYMQWADPLESLGLFEIYSSVWLRMPLALLSVNLVICSVRHFETASRWPPRTGEDPTGTMRSASDTDSLLLPGSKESTWPMLRRILKDLGYGVHVDEAAGTKYLIASRFSAARWGPFLIHTGALLALAGILSAGRLSWRELGIALAPGQQYQFEHAPSIAIRLDNLNPQTDTGGPETSYEATITVLENGQEVATGTTLPGAPLRHRQISIWQLRHEPLVHLRATSAQGDLLPLQALAPSGQIVDQVTVQFDEDEREGYVAVPARDLVLRLLLEMRRPDRPDLGGQVLLEAYRGGTTVMASSISVGSPAPLEIEGDYYHIDWGQYAVLAASRDLTVLPISLGATVVLAGSMVVLFWRHRFVWATVKDNEGVSQIEVFNPNPQEGGHPASDFVQLVSRLKETFGAP
jgi:hypothetical protein